MLEFRKPPPSSKTVGHVSHSGSYRPISCISKLHARKCVEKGENDVKKSLKTRRSNKWRPHPLWRHTLISVRMLEFRKPPPSSKTVGHVSHSGSYSGTRAKALLRARIPLAQAQLCLRHALRCV